MYTRIRKVIKLIERCFQNIIDIIIKQYVLCIYNQYLIEYIFKLFIYSFKFLKSNYKFVDTIYEHVYMFPLANK